MGIAAAIAAAISISRWMKIGRNNWVQGGMAERIPDWYVDVSEVFRCQRVMFILTQCSVDTIFLST